MRRFRNQRRRWANEHGNVSTSIMCRSLKAALLILQFRSTWMSRRGDSLWRAAGLQEVVHHNLRESRGTVLHIKMSTGEQADEQPPRGVRGPRAEVLDAPRRIIGSA